ncbi:MAG TPA: Lrp/AsnC family transcriptional regulator [Anaerolineales bacterium]|nr:Lrp/AsnC family transcriptional regulator [Anaerolineales bacterium]
MTELDITNVKIVDLLMENGRMSAAEIARRVGGISERSVRYRIQRMEEEGFIKVSAIVNPKLIGLTVIADVFIEVESGRISEVAHQLAEFEYISYVACAIGERDISVQVVAHDSDEVYTVVTEIIGKLPGIRKTTTSIVPLVLKDVYEWHIPKSALCS